MAFSSGNSGDITLTGGWDFVQSGGDVYVFAEDMKPVVWAITTTDQEPTETVRGIPMRCARRVGYSTRGYHDITLPEGVRFWIKGQAEQVLQIASLELAE